MKNYNLKFKNKKLILFSGFLVFLFSGFLVLAPGGMVAQAQAQTGGAKALQGLNDTAKEGFGVEPAELEGGGVSSIVGKIVGAALAFVGLIFLILMIYGGFIWMTAGGNEEKVHTAINMIVQAVVGFIVVSAAYLITQFVGETVTLPFIQG